MNEALFEGLAVALEALPPLEGGLDAAAELERALAP
jgi:hypothetical protein